MSHDLESVEVFIARGLTSARRFQNPCLHVCVPAVRPTVEHVGRRQICHYEHVRYTRAHVPWLNLSLLPAF